MAAPRRRTAQPWWRVPVLQAAPRRRAELVLALAAVAGLAVGAATGTAVATLAADPPVGPAVTGAATALGPVTITLPVALGPWAAASPHAAEDLRRRWAGPVDLDGIWGELAPGPVVVAVVTAKAGAHGGVAQFAGSVPQDEPAEWSGGREHVSGSRVVGGVRELVLVTEAGTGDLVVLSVSGPEAAFASGELLACFRTADVA